MSTEHGQLSNAEAEARFLQQRAQIDRLADGILYEQRRNERFEDKKYEPTYTITVRRYRLGERLRAAWAVLFYEW